jgi:glycosyltransferase involved in cell wall biosynthesis
MARVSVIIPAYNAERFVAEAIESALGQTGHAPEVIVVNDGSTDGTERVIDRYRGRVKYLVKSNGGVSSARNAGLDLAGGESVLFLDADDRLTPEALRVLLAVRPGAAVVYGDVDYVDERTGDGRTARVPALAGAAPHPARHLFVHGGIPPSAFLIPAELARRVGGFDPRFSYAADLHFFLRCGSLSPFVRAPEVVLHYRQHDSNMSRQYRKAVADNVDARVAYQEWCQDNGLASPLTTAWTRSRLLNRIVGQCIDRRAWYELDVVLDLAREWDLAIPAGSRGRALRRVPQWVFGLKDRLDRVVRRGRAAATAG